MLTGADPALDDVFIGRGAHPERTGWWAGTVPPVDTNGNLIIPHRTTPAPITATDESERNYPRSPVLSRCGLSSQTRTMPPDEPPEQIVYDLHEALTLLGALEDARDALIDSGHLAVVIAIETEIRALSRKLGFDDPAGGTDGR